MKSNKYCVIMAGGIGSRFWPLSTSNKPKQFLDILNVGRSLLQQTYDRFVQIIPAENILIVTGVEYVDIVHEQLPSIPFENILAEPMRRNTAPCIAYASYKIYKKNSHASIVVAPADHLIINEEDFINKISEGLNFATQTDVLLTLGITPDRPATGFGYIQIDSIDEASQYQKVKSFTEKPHLELAKFFVKSGEFYWNSGIFLWSVKAIKQALAEFLPELSNLFEDHSHAFGTDKEKEAINKIYSAAKNVSIDYGVMEKADNVFIRCTNFGWSDLGTWDSLYNVSEKDENQNVSHGDMIALFDSDNNYVQIPNGKLAVIKDIDNMIIVDSGDKILVCNRENEQWVKELIAEANQRFNLI